MEQNDIFVALDMSLKSPGMAIYNKNKDFWHLYGFAQKKSQINMSKKLKENVLLKLFPLIIKNDTSSDVIHDVERYKFIVDHFIGVLSNPKIVPPNSNIKVYIEAYAFPKNDKTGFNYKLQEMGGSIKLALLNIGIHQIYSIVGSKWKKYGIGSATAEKVDTFNFIGKFFGIDLFQIFGIKKTIKNGIIQIPNPWQDIADAIGILLSILHPIDPKTIPKVKKQKIEHYVCQQEDGFLDDFL